MNALEKFISKNLEKKNKDLYNYMKNGGYMQDGGSFYDTLVDLNMMSAPTNYLWALPNKGIFGAVKAGIGLASGLSGAALGYANLFDPKASRGNMLLNKELSPEFIDKMKSKTGDSIIQQDYNEPNISGKEFDFTRPQTKNLKKFYNGGPFKEDTAAKSIFDNENPVKTEAELAAEKIAKSLNSNNVNDNNVYNPANQIMRRQGPVMANNAIRGFAMANDFLESRDLERLYNEKLRQLGSSDFMIPDEVVNPYGNYTLNAGVSNNFQPMMTTPQLANDGGMIEEILDLTPEQIEELRKQGYDIEILD